MEPMFFVWFGLAWFDFPLLSDSDYQLPYFLENVYLGWGKQKWHIQWHIHFFTIAFPIVFQGGNKSIQRWSLFHHGPLTHSPLPSPFSKNPLPVDASKPSHLCAEIFTPCLRSGELFVSSLHPLLPARHWPITWPRVHFAQQISFALWGIVGISQFQYGWNFPLISFIQICGLGTKECNKYTFTSPSFVGNPESSVSPNPWLKPLTGLPLPFKDNKSQSPEVAYKALHGLPSTQLSSVISLLVPQIQDAPVILTFFYPFKITFIVLFQMIKVIVFSGRELENTEKYKKEKKITCNHAS